MTLGPATMTLATPLLYWACAFAATGLGGLLAVLEDGAKTSGGSPAAHVYECADSADLLLKDLFSDGTGLGLLEPLWRLCTPEGALWTLFSGWSPRDSAASLGFGGLMSALVSVVGAFFGFWVAAIAKLLRLVQPKKKGEESAEAHDEIKMTFRMELDAYSAYLQLFALGLVREYLLRFFALVWRDEISLGYTNRERWSTGWVDFYLQHMYKLYVDCFHRPIASAPDASFDVVVRSRPGGLLWSPLHDFVLSSKVIRCVNLASYNYLGFGGVDPHCTPAAKAAANEYGWSTCATRTEGGTLALHRELEQEVAEYLSKEDALVLGMGFATNSTILPALFEAGEGTGVLVISDELNHRSIVEGVRLSGATVRTFGHNNMPSLEKELQRAIKQGQPAKGGRAPNGDKDAAPKAVQPWRKIFVVVEGIYSMEGDFCRLREIVTLKNRYGAYLYLDEAHSIGAVGPSGRGVTELLGVPTSEVDVMMGTFTKSFGSAGGYVASSKEVIAALRRCAPGSTFASAMSPPCVAQTIAAFRVINGKAHGDRGRQKIAAIRDNSNYFRLRLEEEGFKVIGDLDSPIVPAMTFHPSKLGYFSRYALDEGIAVVAVGNPAVPVMYERVRYCISAAHTREQLDGAVMKLTKVGKRLDLLYEKSADPAEKEERAAKRAAHAKWLRSAPLEKRSLPPVAAPTFKPEPLAPSYVPCRFLTQMEELAVSPQEGAQKDFRPLDPLGFGGKMTPKVKEATEATMAEYGFGACGPRGFYGGTMPHLNLEKALCKFLGTEAAIIYSAGVTTASSVLPALVQPGDKIVVDREAHLGIRTGLRLCKAEIIWVPHNDVAAVEEACKGSAAGKKEKNAPQRRTFLVFEALSCRTGQLAPVKELLDLKDKYGALLVLDESLSFGALGATGQGLCEHVGVSPARVDVFLGSLENALAGVGGFCAGRRGIVEHQRLAGAGYCFSAAAPPSSCTAAMAGLEDLASSDGVARRKAATSRAVQLHQALKKALEKKLAKGSFELLSSPESYVQTLRLKAGKLEDDENLLLDIAEKCKAAGALVQVCSPSRCGAERAFNTRIGATDSAAPFLRLSVSSKHSEAEVQLLGDTLATALV